MNTLTSIATRGKFGPYGGQFVPEVLMSALDELETAYIEAQGDPLFEAKLQGLLRTYVGRPTPLTFAARLSDYLGGPKIYLKREDLAHVWSIWAPWTSPANSPTSAACNCWARKFAR